MRTNSDASSGGAFVLENNITFVLPNETRVTVDTTPGKEAVHIFDEEGLVDPTEPQHHY